MDLMTTWFGTFLMDDGKVLDKRLFEKDREAIALRLSLRMEGKLLNEEKELAVKAGGEALTVYEPRLEKLGGYLSLETPPVMDHEDFGYDPLLLQKAYVLNAERTAYGERALGKDIVNLARARDDLLSCRGLIYERLFAWTNECYPGLVSLNGWVRAISQGEQDKAAGTSGLDTARFHITDPEKAAIEMLAREYAGINSAIDGHDEMLRNEMGKAAPNLSRLLGPILGAKIIMMSNGLDRLAMSSSSKVQLLGAEKALFRHKRKGAKPPKHGILLQHPYVHGARPASRGRRARTLANKVVIAARADAFTKNELPPEFFEL